MVLASFSLHASLFKFGCFLELFKLFEFFLMKYGQATCQGCTQTQNYYINTHIHILHELKFESVFLEEKNIQRSEFGANRQKNHWWIRFIT